MNKLLLFFILFFCLIFSMFSCKFCLQQTYGRYKINKEYNNITKLDTNFTITIPYELWNGIPLIKVNINGSECQFSFLFDSGAFTSGTIGLAKKVNAVKNKIKIKGALDSNLEEKRATLFLFEKIKINDLIISKMNIKCYDKLVDPQIDGILGVDFMENKTLYFDHKNQLLTISNKKKYNHSNFIKKKIWKSWDKRYYIYLDFFKNKNKILIDTGFDSFIKLTEESGAFKNVKPKKSYLIKSNGAFSSQYYIENYYELLDEKFLNKQKISGVIESGNQNLLGFGLFRKMDVLLDFQKKYIYLYPDSSKLILGNEIPSTSLKLTFLNTKLTIEKIESNLYGKLTLLPGDIILSIDNDLIPNELEKVINYIDQLENKDQYKFQIQREDSIFNCDIDRIFLINTKNN